MREFQYMGPQLQGDGLGGSMVGGFYRPDPAEILSVATPGHFYRPTATETIYGISKRAYGTATPGIYRINDSKWNGYIRKGKSGWTAYGIEGVQLQNRYSNNPLRSAYGSGNNRPILWIPPFDSSEPAKPTGPIFGPYIPSAPQPTRPTTPPVVIPATPKKPSDAPVVIPAKPKKPSDGPVVIPATPKKPSAPKKRAGGSVPSVPSAPKKRSGGSVPSVPTTPTLPKPKKPTQPGPTKPSAGPPSVKIVPVPVPYPVKEKRKEWSPWLVGGIALALGLVVSEDRSDRS